MKFPNRSRREESTAETMADRRTFPRVSSSCVVDYRRVENDPMFQQLRDANQGLLQNISGGGVCMRLPSDPGLGALLAVNIRLPHFPTPVIALGKVCWSVRTEDGATDVGLEFWWVGWQDPMAQEQIRDFITNRLADPDEE